MEKFVEPVQEIGFVYQALLFQLTQPFEGEGG
jgi:hypothetical protein